jgi:hypothetical protein
MFATTRVNLHKEVLNVVLFAAIIFCLFALLA